MKLEKSWKSIWNQIKEYSLGHKRQILFGIGLCICAIVGVVSLVLTSSISTNSKNKIAANELSGSSIELVEDTNQLVDLTSQTGSDKSESTVESDHPIESIEPFAEETEIPAAELPVTEVVINETTSGTIDNPNLTLDENGNYISSTIDSSKKEEYTTVVNQSNQLMNGGGNNSSTATSTNNNSSSAGSSNSSANTTTTDTSGVMKEENVTSPVVDNTSSFDHDDNQKQDDSIVIEITTAPVTTPTPKPIVNGNYSDTNLPEYLYTLPLTVNGFGSTAVTNQELTSVLSAGEINYHINRAKNYINSFYNISYKDIVSEKQFNDKLNEILAYFHPEDKKKDNSGNVYTTKNYVNNWLLLIRNTKTEIKAKYYTNPELFMAIKSLMIAHF